jgi:hypothetical protein
MTFFSANSWQAGSVKCQLLFSWEKCVPLSLLILPKQIQAIDDGEYIHTPMVTPSVPFQTPLQPNTTIRFSEFHDNPHTLYSSKSKQKEENSIHRLQIKGKQAWYG